MSLDEINNQLYRPNNSESSPKVEPSILTEKKEPVQNAFLKEESWEGKKDPDEEKRKKTYKIVAGVIVLSLILGGAIFAFNIARKNAFQEDRISIEIKGDLEISGDLKNVYVIEIKNNNKVKLSNVELELKYSENFKIDNQDNLELVMINSTSSKLKIGEIAAQQNKKITISGKSNAPQNTTIYINAKISYSPGNYTNKYERENQIGIKTVSAPVFVDITAPVSATDGDPVSYTIDYRNLGEDVFSDAYVKIIYPNGFTFLSSTPVPSENNNVWSLGDLQFNAEGKIIVNGNLSGTGGERKPIQVLIGKMENGGNFVMYNRGEKNTSISESFFSITQSLNGNVDNTVNPGDNLTYNIKYKNSGEYSLRDVEIKIEFKSNVLDFSKLQTKNGYYESKTNTVSWKASDIPELASLETNAEGNISLLIPVLEVIPIGNENDKNFNIYSLVTADTPSILDPVGSNKIISSVPLNLKLNTTAAFAVKGYHKDNNIENFGPMPLKLGEETSFVLRWEVSNSTNDISDAKVVATLPSGVKWTNRIYPSGEKISYDIRTNEVVWEIGNLNAGKGILNSKKSVAFQVSLVPQPNQVGEYLKLINGSKLTAKDAFTGKEIFSDQKEKTTYLPEDTFLDSSNYIFRNN